MRNKEQLAKESRVLFDLEADRWSKVVPEAPTSLYIPPYYSNQTGNYLAKKILEEQTSASLYWALKYKLDNDDEVGRLASTYLTKWALTMNEIENAEASLAMVMEGNKFLQARFYLSEFDWNKDIFDIWIRDIYQPAAHKLMTYPNNKGAWGWLGWLRSNRIQNISVIPFIGGLSDHFHDATNQSGVMIYEILRTNSGMWYVNFALEAYIQALFDYWFFDNADLFPLIEKTLDWYFQFCIEPEQWPYRLPRNPIFRWITQKMYPCSDTLELPRSTDWPAHILDLCSVYMFNKPEWEAWIHRPMTAGGLNIFKYSTLTWTHDLLP